MTRKRNIQGEKETFPCEGEPGRRAGDAVWLLHKIDRDEWIMLNEKPRRGRCYRAVILERYYTIDDTDHRKYGAVFQIIEGKHKGELVKTH